MVREVVVALGEWLTNPDQEELRRSFLIWLREGFLQALLPTVAFPELNNLEEVRNMLTERVSEQRLLLRLIRRRFGGAIAAQSASVLGQIEQLAVFENLGEKLFDCTDEIAWLTRLQAGEDRL